MLKLKNVVVAINPDQEQQPALDKVLTLAKLAEFDITLISAEYNQYLVDGYYFDAIDLPTLRQEFLDDRTQSLERLAKPLRAAGLNVETLAVWGHPAYEAIIREAMKLNADLLVQHTRHHSALSRLLLTHHDWQLVRCSPMPLLLVKEQDWRDSPTILAAVDPKHRHHKPQGLDHKLLHIATDVAELTEGEVYVMHSYNRIPTTGRKLELAKEDHERAFNGLMADFNIPKENCYLTEEAPEFAMSELEKDIGADIVVMGAISRSMLADVFIGSTTEKVLDFLDCDVLIVKPDDFVSPVQPD